MGPEDWTQVIKLASKRLYSTNPLTSPQIKNFVEDFIVLIIFFKLFILWVHVFVCSEVLGGGDGVSFCWAILLVPENYDSCSCIFTDNSLITSSSQLYNQLKAMSYTKYTGQRFRTSDLWLHFLQLELGCTDFLRHMLCLGFFLFYYYYLHRVLLCSFGWLGTYWPGSSAFLCLQSAELLPWCLTDPCLLISVFSYFIFDSFSLCSAERPGTQVPPAVALQALGQACPTRSDLIYLSLYVQAGKERETDAETEREPV